MGELMNSDVVEFLKTIKKDIHQHLLKISVYHNEEPTKYYIAHDKINFVIDFLNSVL